MAVAGVGGWLKKRWALYSLFFSFLYIYIFKTPIRRRGRWRCAGIYIHTKSIPFALPHSFLPSPHSLSPPFYHVVIVMINDRKIARIPNATKNT